MGSKWSKSTLGDLITLQRGFDLSKDKRTGGDIPVIASTGIAGWHSNAKVKAPGVVIGRSGSIGGGQYIDKDFWPLNTTLWVKDFKGNCEKFCYYLLKTIDFEVFNVGSGVPTLNRNHIHPFPVSYPNVNEQKAIAHILGSLDDKIELNRQMNETLETMAQTLFKSWFVDFDSVIDNALRAGNPIPDTLAERAQQRQALLDKGEQAKHDISQDFPGEFEYTEELGWIPKGWEIKAIDSLVNLIGGGTPKTNIEEYWNGNIPWFSVVDAPSPENVFAIDTEKHITQEGLENSSAKVLPPWSTIISARVTVGKCAMTSQAMTSNQSCYGVIGREGIPEIFTYYCVLLKVSELQARGHGSVFNTITRDTFKTIKIPFSGSILIGKAEKIIRLYFEKILSNNIQSANLSNLRDTLLPKLLSGELRIPDADKLLEEALA